VSAFRARGKLPALRAVISDHVAPANRKSEVASKIFRHHFGSLRFLAIFSSCAGMVPGTALWCRALFRRRAAQAGQMRSSVFLPLRVRALGRSRLGLPPHPVRRPFLPGNGSGRISGCWTSQVPKRRTHKAAAESSEQFHVGCAFDKVDPENPIECHGDTDECPSDAAPKADNRDLSSPSTPGGTKKEPPARPAGCSAALGAYTP
jgi:hypothetical protein